MKRTLLLSMMLCLASLYANAETQGSWLDVNLYEIGLPNRVTNGLLIAIVLISIGLLIHRAASKKESKTDWWRNIGSASKKKNKSKSVMRWLGILTIIGGICGLFPLIGWVIGLLPKNVQIALAYAIIFIPMGCYMIYDKDSDIIDDGSSDGCAGCLGCLFIILGIGFILPLLAWLFPNVFPFPLH